MTSSMARFSCSRPLLDKVIQVFGAVAHQHARGDDADRGPPSTTGKCRTRNRVIRSTASSQY